MKIARLLSLWTMFLMGLMAQDVIRDYNRSVVIMNYILSHETHWEHGPHAEQLCYFHFFPPAQGLTRSGFPFPGRVEG